MKVRVTKAKNKSGTTRIRYRKVPTTTATMLSVKDLESAEKIELSFAPSFTEAERSQILDKWKHKCE